MTAGTRQSVSDSFGLEDLKRAVELSSVCIGVFNEKTSGITEPNQALRNLLSHDEAWVDIVATDDDRVYGRLKNEGIPESLRVLRGKDGRSLVEVGGDIVSGGEEGGGRSMVGCNFMSAVVSFVYVPRFSGEWIIVESYGLRW